MFGMPQAAGERLAGSKQVRAARTRILNVLLDDLEPLADRAVAAIWAEIPAYGSKDERFAADVRDQVLRHYRANLHSFLEDRQVTREDLSFTRGAATRRARAGFGLEDYLNAYRVGQQVLWEGIVAAAGESAAGRAAALTPTASAATCSSTCCAASCRRSPPRAPTASPRRRGCSSPSRCPSAAGRRSTRRAPRSRAPGSARSGPSSSRATARSSPCRR